VANIGNLPTLQVLGLSSAPSSKDLYDLRVQSVHHYKITKGDETIAMGKIDKDVSMPLYFDEESHVSVYRPAVGEASTRTFLETVKQRHSA